MFSCKFGLELYILLRFVDSIYLFDFNNKDESDNLSSTGTVVLLKFDTLH